MFITQNHTGRILDLYDEKYNHLVGIATDPSIKVKKNHIHLNRFSEHGIEIPEELDPVIYPINSWSSLSITGPEGHVYQIQMKIEPHLGDLNATFLFRIPDCVKVLKRSVVIKEGIEKYRNAADLVSKI